jgi:nicotinamide-nucleotide amidase
MQAELIIIGNELLNGKIKDKNIPLFSRFCYQNKVTLVHVHIIPDNEGAFKETLDLACKRSDLIITSGGLGPTQDDLTKAMMAKYFNKTIQFSQEALEITESHYQRDKREFNRETNDYPNIPNDFKALYNPTGYAPGLFFEFEKQKFIINTPGVPSEFKSILHQSIKSLIPKLESFEKHIIIKTLRIPESKIFNELCPTLWCQLEKYGQVSSLPHPMGVDIGVTINDPKSEQEILKLIENSELKAHIWHIGPESLEDVIIHKAKEKNLKIGFAESCTGGLCASRLTDVAGSSSVFWGSIVSYSNEVKIKALNVSEQTLIDHGAVSLETAKEMAIGARLNMNLDIAVTTTGIAGPGGGSKEKPVGTVAIGFSTQKESGSDLLHMRGNREDLKFRFSQAALFKLLELINAYS